MIRRRCSLALALPLACLGFGIAGGNAPAPMQPQPKHQPDAKAGAEDPAYVLGFKMKRIDGKEEDLSIYKGKVVIIVNVASRCGFTGQYKALEQLYKDHKDEGLVILGFPANNFREQEPGSNSEIAEFCKSTYDVNFPMFEKISVKGDDQHPLYKKLAGQPAPIGGDPKWNFTKFVVNKEGKVVARFDAKGDGKTRDALEPGLVKKVEELLGVSGMKEKDKQEPKKQPPAGS
jgi:glutathione peroxidase